MDVLLPEGAQFGWGGYFADALSGANTNPVFTGITSGGNELFLTGASVRPYQISSGGAAAIFSIEEAEEPLASVLRRHHRAAPYSDTQNLIAQDLNAMMQTAFDANQLYNASLAQVAPITTPFPGNDIGSQLRAVANTIAIREQLGARRQIFVVGMGGYDTHSDQARSLPGLHTALDGAITAFHSAMQALNLANNVTLFTASDFGRTLAVNGDGTDHGWGAHHFVVGGAVRGGEIYGEVPPSSLGHSLDAGNGRLIPSLAVEQFAAPLGRWFGVSESAAATALPNAANFSTPPAFI